MCSATALPKDSSLQSVEDRLRKRLKEVKRNSLGSEYVAFHAGRDEVIALAESDLVVEVGLTHESKEKYLSYRDKGAVEFWQLNIRRRAQRRIITATFLDLQAQPGPLEVDTSLNLPGLAPAHVIRFIQLRSGKSLDYLEVYEAVRDLLSRDALEIREETEEYELVS